MKFMTNEYTVTFQHEKNLEKVYWYIKRKQQSDTFMCFTILCQLKHRNAPIIFLNCKMYHIIIFWFYDVYMYNRWFEFIRLGDIIYVDFVETEIELWDNPFWYCFAAMWCGKYIIKMWITIRDRDEEHKICKINEGKLPSWD